MLLIVYLGIGIGLLVGGGGLLLELHEHLLKGGAKSALIVWWGLERFVRSGLFFRFRFQTGSGQTREGDLHERLIRLNDRLFRYRCFYCLLKG